MKCLAMMVTVDRKDGGSTLWLAFCHDDTMYLSFEMYLGSYLDKYPAHR